MATQALNVDLIGVKGGRARIATPALVIDLDVMERNIAAMAAHAKQNAIALRPHAKTHKCSQIAKRQIAAGALGICCAKLGEAEALADAGIESILITSPVVTDSGIARLMALNARIRELTVVCDNLAIAQKLADAASAKPLRIFVDMDPGMSRTGIRPGVDALALVKFVAESNTLSFEGLQCYAGQAQHIEQPKDRRDASLAVMKDLAAFRNEIVKAGYAPRILSGGGTGTFDIDPAAHALTELQVGSYVFMDRQYNDVWEKPGERPPFETSLFVQTTVISANRDGLATTDAGFKSFATDADKPLIAAGAPAGASYFFFGDEQGGILYGGEPKLKVGDVIACVVPHCDPTVNLYDRYHCVRGDTLEAIWAIEGRGGSA
ncbi:MAG TPA: DSD1 family PLP-dependent enzyme [Rhizomicrobium sp.]|jgi:D-serine deaminase-like pyridoxal phosphate-dependent protein